MSNHGYVNLGSPHEVHHRKPKNYKIRLLLGGFFIVLAIILATTFLGTPQLTGNTLFTGKSIFDFNKDVEETGIAVSGILNIPSLTTKSEFKEIIISARPSSHFYIADEKITMPNNKETIIILKEFEGKITFENDNVAVDGWATRVLTEGIPISSKSKDKIKVKVDENLDYEYFRILENFNFRNLEYDATGNINVEGQTSISLSNERINIRGYVGNLRVQDGNFILDGKAKGVTVNGEKKIEISS